MLANLFRAVADRLKAVFAAAVAAEFEADALARAAERQAELPRLADRYAAGGLLDRLRGLLGLARRERGETRVVRSTLKKLKNLDRPGR